MEVNEDFKMGFTLNVTMALNANGNRVSPKALNRTLGQRLMHFRKLRGYSQEELARRVDAVQVVISDYEHGKLRLSAEMAIRFSAVLDVPIQQLLEPSKPIAIEPQQKPNRKLLRRMEQIERLPRRKQAALLTTIDVFLKSATA